MSIPETGAKNHAKIVDRRDAASAQLLEKNALQNTHLIREHEMLAYDATLP